MLPPKHRKSFIQVKVTGGLTNSVSYSDIKGVPPFDNIEERKRLHSQLTKIVSLRSIESFIGWPGFDVELLDTPYIAEQLQTWLRAVLQRFNAGR